MTAKNSGQLTERLTAVLELPDSSRAIADLASLSEEMGRSAPAQLIRLLTHLNVQDSRAEELLREAFRRRDEIREQSGYDIGARLALFDLLTKVRGTIPNPKIIDVATFEQIERSAITDALTGLHNRGYFESRLMREIRRARRYSQHLSLLLLDLDNFKIINDTLGHPVGDDVLKEFGALVNRCVRDVDLAARYGGEEFAVILPETRRKGALIVAERVRTEVERIFRRKGGFERALKLTVSGGLSSYPEDAEEPAALLSKADKALYRAKSAGKNLINVYFEEKRRAARIPVEERKLKAVLRADRGGRRVRQNARVRNISEGGLLVELTEPIPVGSEIQVSFSLDDEHAYTFRSTVVRLESGDSNGKRRRYEAGLRFQRKAKSLIPELNRLARRRLAAG